MACNRNGGTVSASASSVMLSASTASHASSAGSSGTGSPCDLSHCRAYAPIPGRFAHSRQASVASGPSSLVNARAATRWPPSVDCANASSSRAAPDADRALSHGQAMVRATGGGSSQITDITVAASASGDGARSWNTDSASIVPSGVSRTAPSPASAAPNASNPVTVPAACPVASSSSSSSSSRKSSAPRKSSRSSRSPGPWTRPQPGHGTPSGSSGSSMAPTALASCSLVSGSSAVCSTCSTVRHPAHGSSPRSRTAVAALTQAFKMISGSGCVEEPASGRCGAARARRPSISRNPAAAAVTQSRISSSTSSALRSRGPASSIPRSRQACAASAGRSTPLVVSVLPAPTHSASLRARASAAQDSAAAARPGEATTAEGFAISSNPTRLPYP